MDVCFCFYKYPKGMSNYIYVLKLLICRKIHWKSQGAHLYMATQLSEICPQ